MKIRAAFNTISTESVLARGRRALAELLVVVAVVFVEVYLVHSYGTEQRVMAEVHDVTSGSEVKVKVSIPVNYAMDVYIAARDSAASLAGIRNTRLIASCIDL